jgi:hypothetical protein
MIGHKGGFIANANVAKLGPNLILFMFKVRTNGVLYFFYKGATHLFVNPNAVTQLGWVGTKVTKPIKAQLAQGTATSSSEVVLAAILESGKVKFTENFTVCALDGIEAILGNTFVDVYHVNVLRRGFKIKSHSILRDKYINLEMEYQVSLAKVSIHLVSLQVLHETSFLIMHVDEFNAKSKAKGTKSWPTYISNIINKFLDILTNELFKHLPHFCNVDHKIEVVPRSVPPFKSPYMLNKKKLHKLMAQIND